MCEGRLSPGTQAAAAKLRLASLAVNVASRVQALDKLAMVRFSNELLLASNTVLLANLPYVLIVAFGCQAVERTYSALVRGTSMGPLTTHGGVRPRSVGLPPDRGATWRHSLNHRSGRRGAVTFTIRLPL